MKRGEIGGDNGGLCARLADCAMCRERANGLRGLIRPFERAEIIGSWFESLGMSKKVRELLLRSCESKLVFGFGAGCWLFGLRTFVARAEFFTRRKSFTATSGRLSAG